MPLPFKEKTGRIPNYSFSEGRKIFQVRGGREFKPEKYMKYFEDLNLRPTK